MKAILKNTPTSSSDWIGEKESGVFSVDLRCMPPAVPITRRFALEAGGAREDIIGNLS
jgi:hypothetical protein